MAEDVTGQKQKRLSPESRKEMVAKRVALGLNQAELNLRCAFPANMIRDIEAGKVVPNGAQLNVLNRVLKASLHLA